MKQLWLFLLLSVARCHCCLPLGGGTSSSCASGVGCYSASSAFHSAPTVFTYNTAPPSPVLRFNENPQPAYQPPQQSYQLPGPSQDQMVGVPRNTGVFPLGYSAQSIGEGASPGSQLGDGAYGSAPTLSHGAGPDQGTSVGQGAVPMQSYGIGQGANPQGPNIGQGANYGVVQGASPQGPSIGQGASPMQSYGIGQGANPQGPNIGQGAVPNQDPTIGQGANPSVLLAASNDGSPRFDASSNAQQFAQNDRQLSAYIHAIDAHPGIASGPYNVPHATAPSGMHLGGPLTASDLQPSPSHSQMTQVPAAPAYNPEEPQEPVIGGKGSLPPSYGSYGSKGAAQKPIGESAQKPAIVFPPRKSIKKPGQGKAGLLADTVLQALRTGDRIKTGSTNKVKTPSSFIADQHDTDETTVEEDSDILHHSSGYTGRQPSAKTGNEHAHSTVDDNTVTQFFNDGKDTEGTETEAEKDETSYHDKQTPQIEVASTDREQETPLVQPFPDTEPSREQSSETSESHLANSYPKETDVGQDEEASVPAGRQNSAEETSREHEQHKEEAETEQVAPTAATEANAQQYAAPIHEVNRESKPLVEEVPFVTYYNQVCHGEKIASSPSETIRSAAEKCAVLECSAANAKPIGGGKYRVTFLRYSTARTNQSGSYCVSESRLPLRRVKTLTRRKKTSGNEAPLHGNLRILPLTQEYRRI